MGKSSPVVAPPITTDLLLSEQSIEQLKLMANTKQLHNNSRRDLLLEIEKREEVYKQIRHNKPEFANYSDEDLDWFLYSPQITAQKSEEESSDQEFFSCEEGSSEEQPLTIQPASARKEPNPYTQV